MKFKLKKLRVAAKLTQDDVAKILNISRSTYTHIETERTSITLEMAIELCKLFKCTLNDIAGIENDWQIHEKYTHKSCLIIIFVNDLIIWRDYIKACKSLDFINPITVLLT